ncbi:DsbE family thiol:disulfide interchange protein [Methylobacillus gramineus]|uniref:DsbE family thiol:disulfide interchange protein n=1 Tax=Methylobacillus gramineus TaxID=755169 RepID=UPI001CFF8AB7|nr:DsbE family thiol:disulfide interchange protein [Methylobacillus gramineus]MCB5183623.1 DsbE family thiol:disulfide interchange protein [Methylobacillus gramineus]
MKRLFILIPLAAFLILVGFLAAGLRHDPHEVPSPLVGKPAPLFNLPRLNDPQLTLSAAEMQGQVWLFNVWASWCAPCREEHPVLLKLAASQIVPIIGMNYKDERDKAIAWLRQGGGDPYLTSVIDQEGRTGIDYGVYGVPETYVIDKAGIIRYKHIGQLTEQVVAERLLPLIMELNAE